MSDGKITVYIPVVLAVSIPNSEINDIELALCLLKVLSEISASRKWMLKDKASQQRLQREAEAPALSHHVPFKYTICMFYQFSTKHSKDGSQKEYESERLPNNLQHLSSK